MMFAHTPSYKHAHALTQKRTPSCVVSLLHTQVHHQTDVRRRGCLCPLRQGQRETERESARERERECVCERERDKNQKEEDRNLSQSRCLQAGWGREIGT